VPAAIACVLTLGVVTVALHATTGGSALTSFGLGGIAVSVLLLVPGALVAAKRPDNAIGWLLLVAALAVAISGAGREYLAYGFLGSYAPAYLAVGWISGSLFLVSMGVVPLMLMLFPDGHLMSPKVRPWLAIPLLSVVLATFGWMFASDPTGIDVQGHRLYNPARHVFPAWVSDAAGSLGWLLFVAGVVMSIALLVRRYRRSGEEVRLQMKWVVWSGSIAVVELMSEFVPGNDLGRYTGPLVSSLVCASVCVAILRHRLFDIDLVIHRTLVYALLSACVVALYVATVTAVGLVLDEPVEIGPGLVAAAVVALAFGPARSRLQLGVDRLLYGEGRNPYRVMTQLGQRLQSEDASDELTTVVQTIAQALKLPYVGIVGPSGALLAQTGDARPDPVEIPLTYQGADMGRLLVSPSQRTGLDRHVVSLLDDLAGQVGAAVHAVRLSADLQASRARLVSAKEEERRRLRRDLHDGLGPKLAALGLRLDTAHAMADDRPEASKELMLAVKDDIRLTIEDIRQLVYGLRPPALDELGLVAALRECGERFAAATGAPTITVTAPPLPVLSAACEVAAYWIVNEAITNVVRHASASRCDVELRFVGASAGTLRISVVDDGTGLPSGWRPGVGTGSLRERAAELGGTVEVESPVAGGRGTAVRACIPCGTLGE
jgi:signal transduction histidine kinase